MVTIKCQHSGLEFEAKTRRTKMHPKIAQLKDRAAKDGLYREMDKALSTVKSNGGYNTIEEYTECVNDIMHEEKQKQTERQNADLRQQREQEQARSERRARREAQNALLRQHGYEWRVEYVDRDAPSLEERDEGKYFYLVDPDGHQISIEQALDEIARGRDVVRAEIAEREHQQDQERAERERQEREQERVRVAALAEFDRQKATVEAKAQQVKPFDLTGLELVATTGVQSGTYRSRDSIRSTTRNGVVCYVIVALTGYDDDGYYSYYSEDPAAAGLDIIEPSTENSMWDYFGGAS